MSIFQLRISSYIVGFIESTSTFVLQLLLEESCSKYHVHTLLIAELNSRIETPPKRELTLVTM